MQLEANKNDWISGLIAKALGGGLIGTPALIAERIKRYEALGVECLMLTFHPMMEGMEKFAAEVMPLLGRATPGIRDGSKGLCSTTMIPFRYFPIAPLSTTRRSSGRTAPAWRCGWCPISSISTSSSAPEPPTSAITRAATTATGSASGG